MAIRHIREAFNQEAEGHATCEQAFLRYEDDGKGGQHQIITVKGHKPDGARFVMATPAHAMSDDPHHHVRELAKYLKEEPTVEGAGELPPTAGSSTASESRAEAGPDRQAPQAGASSAADDPQHSKPV